MNWFKFIALIAIALISISSIYWLTGTLTWGSIIAVLVSVVVFYIWFSRKKHYASSSYTHRNYVLNNKNLRKLNQAVQTICEKAIRPHFAQLRNMSSYAQNYWIQEVMENEAEQLPAAMKQYIVNECARWMKQHI